MGNRTPVSAVRGRRLNRLTMRPYSKRLFSIPYNLFPCKQFTAHLLHFLIFFPNLYKEGLPTYLFAILQSIYLHLSRFLYPNLLLSNQTLFYWFQRAMFRLNRKICPSPRSPILLYHTRYSLINFRNRNNRERHGKHHAPLLRI